CVVSDLLLDIVVFGRRGRQAMASYVDTVRHPDLPGDIEVDVRDRIERLKASSAGENVARIREELQEHMTDKASVFRTEESLASMASDLDGLDARYERATIQ